MQDSIQAVLHGVTFLGGFENSFIGKDGKEINFSRVQLINPGSKALELPLIHGVDYSGIKPFTPVDCTLDLTTVQGKPAVKVSAIVPAKPVSVPSK